MAATRQPTPRPDGPLIADRAYAELRDRIVTLRLPPGAPLREDHLMADLKLGRTPLREAVKRLALEGLVAVRPRSGTYVTEVDSSDIGHIAEIRAELEAHAAALAALRLDGDRREQALALEAELDAFDAAEDHEAYMRLDERVHRFVWESAANPYLADALERLWAPSLRVWYLVLDRVPALPAAVHEQRALLDALLAGDPDAAATRMREHVMAFESEILEAFAR